MTVLDRLKGGLVASCQPVEKGPMDQVDIVVAMAKAAVAGGASALRVEGVAKVKAVCEQVDVPVIGIVKTEQGEGKARITICPNDAQALIEAGADIVAVDAAVRQPTELLREIMSVAINAQIPVMADCATYADAERAMELGASIVGTTLSGYTQETEHLIDQGPDYKLLQEYGDLCRGTDVLVMAEGRFNSPEEAAKAMLNGADCVTVGSAITRIEHIVSWFTTAMATATAN